MISLLILWQSHSSWPNSSNCAQVYTSSTCQLTWWRDAKAKCSWHFTKCHYTAWGPQRNHVTNSPHHSVMPSSAASCSNILFVTNLIPTKDSFIIMYIRQTIILVLLWWIKYNQVFTSTLYNSFIIITLMLINSSLLETKTPTHRGCTYDG